MSSIKPNSLLPMNNPLRLVKLYRKDSLEDGVDTEIKIKYMKPYQAFSIEKKQQYQQARNLNSISAFQFSDSRVNAFLKKFRTFADILGISFDIGPDLKIKSYQFVKQISQNKHIQMLSFKALDQDLRNSSMKLFASQFSKLIQLQQFSFITGGNKLKEESLNSLGLMLSNFTELKQLTLILLHQPIKQLGAQWLATGLSNCQKLENLKLELKYCPIGVEGAKSIGDCLAKLKRIKVAQLEFFQNNFQNEGSDAIYHALKNWVEAKYISIVMEYNNLKNGFAKGFTSLFKGCQNLETFKFILQQRDSRFGVNGITSLGKGLQESSPKLQSLTINLCQSNLKNNGVSSFTQSLCHCKGLKSLELDFTNNKLLTKQSAIAVGQALKQLTALETLYLGLNVLDLGDEGLEGVISGISQLSVLKSLNLQISESKITDSSIMIVSSYFQGLANLNNININLNHNEISLLGLIELDYVIANLPNIIRVHLYMEHCPCYKFLEGPMTVWFNWRNLDNFDINLSEQKLKAQDLKHLGSFITRYKSLNTLKLGLSDCNIHDEGVTFFSQEIVTCGKELENVTLVLKSNQISAVGARNLMDGLSQIQNLKNIQIFLQENQVKLNDIPQEEFKAKFQNAEFCHLYV